MIDKNSKKIKGQIFTPPFIVKNILDLVDYKNVLFKHIIDNSCGNGAFLCEIVKIYMNEAKNLSKLELKNHLETFIHGIEIDPILYENCIKNLNLVTKNLGEIKWDIVLDDALNVHKFDKKMDFVIGNPPYVRIHNAKKNIKNFEFSKNGMSDLYLVFFEIGLKMLKNDGILGYITPSSYFNSTAAKKMREYFIKNKILCKIVDLEHFQPFNATTYTAITILKKSENLEYFKYDEYKKEPKFQRNLQMQEFFINKNFYFNISSEIKNILNFDKKPKILVKNGFATLCDEFFICDDTNAQKFVINVVKSSTGATKKCIYPYDKNGNLFEYEKLSENLKKYFEQNKQKLQNRSLENKNLWWGFGRTQAINDVYKDKIAINSLIRDKNDIKLTFAECGVGVYGGLYVLCNDLNRIKSVLINDEFITYIKTLKKYKSGGYYTFSSKELEKYINFKMETNNGRNFLTNA